MGDAAGALDDLSLTSKGHDAISRLALTLRDWLVENLEDVEDVDAVGEAMTRVVRRIVVERAQGEDHPRELVGTR